MLWLEILSLFIVVFSVMHNLVSSNWKWIMGALAIQYTALFLFAIENLSFPLALVKLIAGWIATAILGATLHNVVTANTGHPQHDNFLDPLEELPSSAKLLRFLTACLVGIVIYPGINTMSILFPGLRPYQAAAVLTLCSVGWLIVSFRSTTLSTCVGLLSFLGGFEILYVILEPSVMINGLLAGVTLGIAFIGSYLLYVHHTVQE